MTALAISPADILHFAHKHAGAGVVLVTLVGIAGSSPRALGAQMAVAADGDYRGSFSGGCIEAAIVAEALAVLDDGETRMVRFGAGSPYIDIRLPCGGGIDLLFTPRPDAAALRAILAVLDKREPAAMRLSRHGICVAGPATIETGWHGDEFGVTYSPRVRILAMGHGDALTATARLAHYFGAETRAFSPSKDDVTALSAEGIAATLLDSRSRTPMIEADRWTAFAFLFHDHDWEEMLLPWALRQPHLFVGAIGGRQSRTDRIAMLRSHGLSAATLTRFSMPAGLIPQARDPATLALSVVSEIIGAYHCIERDVQIARHKEEGVDDPLLPV